MTHSIVHYYTLPHLINCISWLFIIIIMLRVTFILFEFSILKCKIYLLSAECFLDPSSSMVESHELAFPFPLSISSSTSSSCSPPPCSTPPWLNHRYSNVSSIRTNEAHATVATCTSSPAHTAAIVCAELPTQDNHSRADVDASPITSDGGSGYQYSVPLQIGQDPESKQPLGVKYMAARITAANVQPTGCTSS